MGEKLREARRKAGFSQAELAKEIGCFQKDVSRWESGLVEPGVLTVKKIAQILGCRMEDLV